MLLNMISISFYKTVTKKTTVVRLLRIAQPQFNLSAEDRDKDKYSRARILLIKM